MKSLTIGFQGSSMLYMNPEFIPFYGWHILLYGYTTFCFSIHQLMGIWVVSSFWLLWMMLLWTLSMYMNMYVFYICLILRCLLIVPHCLQCCSFVAGFKLGDLILPTLFFISTIIWLFWAVLDDILKSIFWDNFSFNIFLGNMKN